MSKSYYVYLLKSTKGTTYVGATVNLERRLRQHNKELVGGAKATTSKVKKGESCKRVCYVDLCHSNGEKAVRMKPRKMLFR